VSLSKSQDKEIRLRVASALHNLIEDDNIALRIAQDFGVTMFVAMSDIKDMDIQHLIERSLTRLAREIEPEDTPIVQEETFVIEDDEKDL